MNAKPRALAGVVILVIVTAVSAIAQTAPPTRPQRAALQALLHAADSDAAGITLREDDWPVHLLRASDGSHYVAFSVPGGDTLAANRPVVLYVRLATRRAPRAAAAPERSALGEWLAGQAPTPVPSRRGIAFGDMPTYGAGSIATRGPSAQSQALQLLELERERAREKREAQERARKAALEGDGATRTARALLPFEDFDVRALPIATGGNSFAIRRSLTAGPGEYELTIAWVDAAAENPAAAVRLARRPLTLPPASTTELALSSVILADDVRVREAPVPAADQASHPYSIGATEITPAPDPVLTTDERLALVVQVINARGGPGGKPDVAVGFRLLRRNGAFDEAVGTLAPQIYDATTLPGDFDTAKGHPIFAAVAVPLAKFKRGEYRMEVVANDRLSGTGAVSHAAFTVVATPAAVLRDAPPLVRPFRRDDILDPQVLDEITRQLRPSSPSAAMLGALVTARERRWIELVRDDDVEPDERGARSALRALALYALGDTPAALTASLLQAQQSASAAAVQIVVGALRALEGNHREAATAWQNAVAAGAERGVILPLLIDALVRQGDARGALAAAGNVADLQTDPSLTRRVATAHIAAGEQTEALRLLERRLQDSSDRDAMWLAVNALFRGFVGGTGPGAEADGRARLIALAHEYAASGGLHAAVAREWADVVAHAPPRAP